jgi:cell division septation protein DedD
LNIGILIGFYFFRLPNTAKKQIIKAIIKAALAVIFIPCLLMDEDKRSNKASQKEVGVSTRKGKNHSFAASGSEWQHIIS